MKRLILLAISVVLCGTTFAQDVEGDGNKKAGYLTGSFDNNTIYYLNDAKSNAVAPEDHLGSNNYLKLDYYKGNFSAGLQMEAYLPVLLGYPTNLKKAALTNLYAMWADKGFTITAG